MSKIYRRAAEFQSPLGKKPLPPVPEPGRALVTLRLPFSEVEFGRLGAHLAQYPEARLCFEGKYLYDPTKYDLDFLRHFSYARDLVINLYGLTNLEGLSHVKQLRELRTGFVASNRLSLAPLAACRRLKSLKIDEISTALEVLADLKRLQNLELHRVKLPTLDLLRKHPAMQSLEIMFGNTTDLSAIPSLPKLRSLALVEVRGLADLMPLAAADGLQCLELRGLPLVRRLPPLSKLKKLRFIKIDGLKGLADLRSLATASNLEDLWIEYMPHLTPQHFRPLAGHPQLRRAVADIGSLKKAEQVEELLGIHDTPCLISQFKFRA
jgi:hypothetical protein